MLRAMNYHHNDVGVNPALYCDPFSNTERDDDIYFIKLDIAIHIQKNMIDNIEDGTKSIMEDKFDWHKQIKFISNDTTDYMKFETILNRDMLSIGF